VPKTRLQKTKKARKVGREVERRSEEHRRHLSVRSQVILLKERKSSTPVTNKEADRTEGKRRKKEEKNWIVVHLQQKHWRSISFSKHWG